MPVAGTHLYGQPAMTSKKKKGLKEVQGKGDIGIKVAMGDGAPKAPGKQP